MAGIKMRVRQPYGDNTYIHARAKCVKNASDSNLDIFLTLIAVRECLCHSLSFVVASANANWINIAPAVDISKLVRSKENYYALVFVLRMNLWIPVHLCQKFS